MCENCNRTLCLNGTTYNTNSGKDEIEHKCSICQIKPYLIWLPTAEISNGVLCPKCLRKHIVDDSTNFIYVGKILKQHRLMEEELVVAEGEKYGDYMANLEEYDSGMSNIDAYSHKLTIP